MARLNQPTYDFLTGAEIPATQQQATRATASTTAKQAPNLTKIDIANEELRAQLRTLQYELDALQQDRQLHDLQHEQDLRDAQSRAEADYKRAQIAEQASTTAKQKLDAVTRDAAESQDRFTNDKLQLEKKVRSLQDDNRSLREDYEETLAELETLQRESRHASGELADKYASLQGSVEGIQMDLSDKVALLQATQQKLAQKEVEVGELENEVLRWKAQTGDADTLVIIKKELTEQVAYIKKLETTNREHVAELKQFRKTQKNVEVVEEEKRGLEVKVRMMEDLRKELAEAQLQKRILEDEKKGWSSYLENEANAEDDMRYNTPEEMAKAFLQERLERLSLVDKLGTIQPELEVKEDSIRSLQDEKAQLQSEIEKLRSTGSAASVGAPVDMKARARLERQKNLITKEVEYLRAQMKTFEAEEAEFTPEQIDENRSKRIHELEDMVEQYRAEITTMQAEMSSLESLAPPRPQSPLKRTRQDDDDSDERLGSLKRKARSLQDELDKLQTRNQVLEAELKASSAQLASLKESSRTRVLEFRNNPTAEAEAIKLSTLKTLRDENTALLAQLEGRPNGTKVVPISTLDHVRQQLEEAVQATAAVEKKTLRLKQIWAAKSLEFREAVCSILGWKLDFMPNGRVKATSIVYPTTIVNGEEEENSIVFDGENGTMKVSGGPRSVFAGEIKGLIEFWVEGRKDIPAFLAALTLEFSDRMTKAQKG